MDVTVLAMWLLLAVVVGTVGAVLAGDHVDEPVPVSEDDGVR